MSDALVQFRSAIPDDYRFVAASWFESYWKGNLRGLMAWETYRPGMDNRIRRAFEHGKTLIAFAPSAPSEIIGYAVYEQERLHYAYVKNCYRRMGFGRALVEPLHLECYTHDTGKLGRAFGQALGLRFNPFALEKRT